MAFKYGCSFVIDLAAKKLLLSSFEKKFFEEKKFRNILWSASLSDLSLPKIYKALNFFLFEF